MSFFSSYILSIVGISLLGVVVDLVLVDGQVKKYIKSIFVLFVIFTLISPVPNLINNIKNGEIYLPTAEMDIGKSYLDIILKQKNATVCKSISDKLLQNEIVGAKIDIDSNMQDGLYNIICIKVNMHNCICATTKEGIIKLIQEVVKIPREAIYIYGY